VKPAAKGVRAACFVSASGRLRGEIVRAKPAVQAFRACKGSGWQNGKWLLMGSHQPVRSGWEIPDIGHGLKLSDPARLRPFSLVSVHEDRNVSPGFVHLAANTLNGKASRRAISGAGPGDCGGSLSLDHCGSM